MIKNTHKVYKYSIIYHGDKEEEAMKDLQRLIMDSFYHQD